MSLWIEIKGKFVRPSVHERFQLGPDEESTDESESFGGNLPEIETISGVALILDYSDAKGRLSQRLVTCTRIENNAGIEYLRAFCHKREAIRAFRIDRILSVFDPATGECLNPVKGYFDRFSTAVETDSPYGWGLGVQRRADLVALLNALVFIARCDREFHPFEFSTIEDFVTKFWLRMEIRGEPACDAIAAYVERLAPDAETFWVAMHRIAKEQRLERLLKEGARGVIEADGRQTPEEFFWGSKIDAFFQSHDGS
jgi:hypothetical protein